jgi:hypothetical protein
MVGGAVARAAVSVVSRGTLFSAGREVDAAAFVVVNAEHSSAEEKRARLESTPNPSLSSPYPVCVRRILHQ